MNEHLATVKRAYRQKLALLAIAMVFGVLILGTKEVKAAEPLFTYKDEKVYRVGDSLRDKDMNYLIRVGQRAQFTATQSVYGRIAAVDWQTGVDGGNIITIVGGKPDVGKCERTVTIQGVRPGVAVLNGRILSTSTYDTQWCDNKFPVHVVEPISAITLEKDRITLSPGKTAETAIATMTPDSMYSLLASWPLTYTSTNPAVADVDDDGNITAASSGTATIRVSTRDGVSAACTVTVREDKTEDGSKKESDDKKDGASTAESLSLNKKSMTLQLGKKGTLTAKQNGKTVTPVYSGGKGIVSISKKGVITAKKIGTATIKVTYKKKTKTCKVTVVPKAISLQASASKKNVTLKWKKASNVNGYKIYRASSAKGKYKEIKTVNAKTKKLVLKNNKKGTYYYKIRSYKKVNGKNYQGALSKAVRVKVK